MKCRIKLITAPLEYRAMFMTCMEAFPVLQSFWLYTLERALRVVANRRTMYVDSGYAAPLGLYCVVTIPHTCSAMAIHWPRRIVVRRKVIDTSAVTRVVPDLISWIVPGSDSLYWRKT